MPGDLIKIGRVRFKIKEICSRSYLKLVNNNSLCNKLMNEDYHHVQDLADVGIQASMRNYTPREPNRGVPQLNGTQRCPKQGERLATDPDIGIN